MASLKKILELKLIKDRKEILSNYLKENPIGDLSIEDRNIFIEIFDRFYTPDNEEQKIKVKEVEIVRAAYSTKCFYINRKYNCSIKKLAGSKAKKNCLTIAMRNSIKQQILDFKELNKLNENSICPILKCPLGLNAEIDHETPFYILKNDWLKNEGKNAKYYYCNIEKEYILEKEFFKSWNNYHFKNAKLRWLSKEGNKIAHFKTF